MEVQGWMDPQLTTRSHQDEERSRPSIGCMSMHVAPLLRHSTSSSSSHIASTRAGMQASRHVVMAVLLPTGLGAIGARHTALAFWRTQRPLPASSGGRHARLHVAAAGRKPATPEEAAARAAAKAAAPPLEPGQQAPLK